MTMNNTMKANKLREAAQLIRNKGLARGQMRGEQAFDGFVPPLECSHCAMGAVIDVTKPEILEGVDHVTEWDSDVVSILLELADDISPDRDEVDFFGPISRFNDRAPRTSEGAQRVIDALEFTAARLDKTPEA